MHTNSGATGSDLRVRPVLQDLVGEVAVHIAAEHDRVLGAVAVQEVDDPLPRGNIARPAVGPDMRLGRDGIELAVRAHIQMRHHHALRQHVPCGLGAGKLRGQPLLLLAAEHLAPAPACIDRALDLALAGPFQRDCPPPALQFAPRTGLGRAILALVQHVEAHQAAEIEMAIEAPAVAAKGKRGEADRQVLEVGAIGVACGAAQNRPPRLRRNGFRRSRCPPRGRPT